MSKFNSLLKGRFKTEKKEKMNQLVERTTSGHLSNFAGVFQMSPLSESDTASLESLLKKYKTEETDIKEDLKKLTTITSEVKAISNQAVLLHGQRIKLAQDVLKEYQDGAFTAWLLETYGNRQTPYNFLQYFELYSSLPSNMKGIIDEMPRQAIYSLSSRSIPQEEKLAFIERYQGETKSELLEKLRDSFPLPKKDKRNPNRAKTATELLKKALKTIQDDLYNPTTHQRQEMKKLLDEIRSSF